METLESRTVRNRYHDFSPVGIRVHPFKRLAALLAKAFPPRWKFSIFGLPAKAKLPVHPQSETLGDGLSVRHGIACQDGAHLDSSGAYLPDLTLGTDEFIRFRFLQKQRFFPRVRQVEGRMVSLSSDGDRNYYRWLMETLPRFRYLREKELQADWLYVCQQAAFHRDSLQIFGFSGEILPSEKNRFVQASCLLLPKFVTEAETWVLPWLRSTLLPLAKERPSWPKRIYISRKKAHGRRVCNEDPLLEFLQARGYTSLFLEDMTWLDQVKLFSEAEAIVAPHGAGLANLVFCQPEAKIVELISPAYPFTFYPEISRQNRVHHQLLPCDAVDSARVHCSDIRVDVSQLARLLR